MLAIAPGLSEHLKQVRMKKISAAQHLVCYQCPIADILPTELVLLSLSSSKIICFNDLLPSCKSKSCFDWMCGKIKG